METVIAAIITSVVTFAGVVVTVRGSRRASTSQHEEQTAHLLNIQERQTVMLETIDANRQATVEQLAVLHNKVDNVVMAQDSLLSMLVDVEAKVTKPAKRKVSVVEPVGGF